MINGLVDNQPTVMRFVRNMQLAMLRRVFLTKIGKNSIQGRGLEPFLYIAIDSCPWGASIKALKYLGSNIIIDQDYSLLRFGYQLFNKDISIKTIKYFINLLVSHKLLKFNSLKSLEYCCIINEKMPHFYKGIHNSDTRIYCCFGMKHRCQHGYPLFGERIWSYR